MLEIDGFQKYVEDAQSLYGFYIYNVRMIMVKYKVKSEVDVILASATYGWEDEIEENKGKISQIIKDLYESITKTCRKLFFSNIMDEKEKVRKAYAWYYIANCEKSRQGNDSFLGFPWVVTDCLCKIGKKKVKYNNEVNYIIGKSSFTCFTQRYKNLVTDINRKFTYVERIEREINHFTKVHFQVSKGFIVKRYGSTSIFVNESGSDVDICACATDELYNSSLVEEKEKFLELS